MADFKVNRRLKKIIEEIYQMSPVEFAKKYNDPKAVKTYNILSERNGLSQKMLDIILQAYPEINKVWLLTGEGDMLTSHHPEIFEYKAEENSYVGVSSGSQDILNKHLPTVKDRIQFYIDTKGISTNELERSIQASKSYWRNTKSISAEILTKIVGVYSDLNTEWLLTGHGEMLKDAELQVLHHPKATERKVEEQDVLLYDIGAAANLKTLLANKSQNILGVIHIPDMPKCDGAVCVTGDSMYPLLKSGDIIAYKELRDFSNVIYGEMYLVSFEIEGDEFLVVKYVNRSELEGHIKLVSYNPHHDPKDIPVSCISAMALVKLSIRKNVMR